MEVTEEQKQRAEANRLAALAKRKALAESSNNQQERQDAWRLFKCSKISTEPVRSPKTGSGYPDSTAHSPEKFRVRLEICAPDSFSVTPVALLGFLYPGGEECLRRLVHWLSDVSFFSFCSY